jgi:hypothetical protein
VLPDSYKILTPAASELITLSDAKDYLNVDFSSKDALITRLITDARRYAEQMLHKSLVTQTIQMIHEVDPVAAGPLSGAVDAPMDADLFLERPNIPLLGNARVIIPVLMGPVQSFTSVEWQLTRADVPEWTLLPATDDQGNPNYRLDTYAEPNEVNLFTILAAARYRLTYVAGSDALDPKIEDVRLPMLSLINFWYEYREGAPVPDGIRQQFAERRIFML